MHFLQETVEAKYVLLYLVTFIVPALYFVIVMVSLIFWAVERGRPYIPNEMFPDRHIYYPIRHTKKVKVMFIIDGIGVLCVMFPLFIALCASAMADADPWIVGGISAAVGLLILFGLTRIPWGSDVECVITDMQGLTIKRTEKMEKYSISMYQGYTNGGKSNPFKLIFRNIDGSENYIYLPFLAAGDPINVGKDLNEVRNKGHLYQFPNPAYGNPVQNIPIAKANPSQVNPPPVDNGKAEALLAMNEQNKLIADKERYRPYLENVLSRIPYNKKDEFIRRNLKGENIVVFRECQRLVGESLAIVRDLIGDYLTFPNLKYFTSRIYIENVPRWDIEEHLRDYGEIYTDVNPTSALLSVNDVYGTDWRYIEFSAALTNPESFTFDIFINILLWMSEKTRRIFAYAKPNWTAPKLGDNPSDKIGAWANITPFYAVPDITDDLGESCIGILNGKEFRFVVPEMTISYKKDIEADFNMETFIKDRYKVRV